MQNVYLVEVIIIMLPLDYDVMSTSLCPVRKRLGHPCSKTANLNNIKINLYLKKYLEIILF